MTTNTFGRRGLPQSEPRDAALGRSLGFTAVEPAPTPRAALFGDAPEDGHPATLDPPLGRVLAGVPFLTFGLVVFVAMVFAVQKWLAFDVGGNARMSHESLLALGAASRDLVLGGGDWWRVFLAPLLHIDASHLGGNLFALAIVGFRLEPLIGRPWFAATFALSALAGVAASLIGNPPHIVTVGSSGAISGVVALLFVMSLTRRLDPEQAGVIRRTALFFGIPALLPMAFGAEGSTDWNAHLGGAVCGAILGVALLSAWQESAERPGAGRAAGTVAFLCLVLSLGSCLIGAIDYSKYALSAAERIPSALLPDRIDAKGLAQAEDLVRRWPKDPRGRLVLGVGQLMRNQPAAAERELRTVLAMIPNPERSPLAPVATIARPYLAVALGMQNRTAEARATAAAFCGTPASKRDGPTVVQLRKLLTSARICDALPKRSTATLGPSRPASGT